MILDNRILLSKASVQQNLKVAQTSMSHLLEISFRTEKKISSMCVEHGLRASTSPHVHTSVNTSLYRKFLDMSLSWSAGCKELCKSDWNKKGQNLFFFKEKKGGGFAKS